MGGFLNDLDEEVSFENPWVEVQESCRFLKVRQFLKTLGRDPGVLSIFENESGFENGQNSWVEVQGFCRFLKIRQVS